MMREHYNDPREELLCIEQVFDSGIMVHFPQAPLIKVLLLGQAS